MNSWPASFTVDAINRSILQPAQLVSIQFHYLP